jgi:hypothetical protein
MYLSIAAKNCEQKQYPGKPASPPAYFHFEYDFPGKARPPQ